MLFSRVFDIAFTFVILFSCTIEIMQLLYAAVGFLEINPQYITVVFQKIPQ